LQVGLKQQPQRQRREATCSICTTLRSTGRMAVFCYAAGKPGPRVRR
jgi:hypothetical protein